jgi:transposase-like protein
VAHANARTTVYARRLIIARVLAGHRPGEVAKQLGISRQTVYKWMRRWRTEGAARLADRGLPTSFSSAPFRRVLRPTPSPSHREAPVRISLQRVAARMGAPVPAVGPQAGTPGFVAEEHLEHPFGLLASLISFSEEHRRYRDALTALRDYQTRFARPVPTLAAREVRFTASFKAGLVTDLDPVGTVRRRFHAWLTTTGGPAPSPAGAGPVLARPSFPQPTYETLRDLAPGLLLPGVDAVEADTVTLLETNPRFVEAFLLGLNHELAGELRWREFPGDLRHTSFRNFWDGTDTGRLPPIDTWSPAAAVGQNTPSEEARLVLLVRGELLQRHPDCLVLAVRAASARTLGTEERMPIFRGRIEPDMTFLGFDLTAAQARGGGPDHGWFFVLQEQPAAPRFGVAGAGPPVPATWNDLAWTHLTTEAGRHLALADLRLPAAQRPPGPLWGQNAAHMAAILRVRPVRVAWHARRLLPPPGPGE